jgi:AraC-like DNA-binding protein
MNLRVVTPSPKLQSLIRCYYFSESDYKQAVKDVFFADGCIEMVFHVGLDFYRGVEKECCAKVIGQITRPLTMRAIGKGASFGIWFLPHTFSLFSGFPVYELNDKAIACDNVFDRAFIAFVQNALHENEHERLVNGINIYLEEKLSKRNLTRDKIAAHGVQYIFADKGHADLDKLARDCNVSNRYLQKLFREKIGFSPKFLIRIARFQHAMNQLIHSRATSLTQLACETGYYDQAHFIREFKEFTGGSPSRFQLSQHPINQYFLNL